MLNAHRKFPDALKLHYGLVFIANLAISAGFELANCPIMVTK
jgi:hypothetical protein